MKLISKHISLLLVCVSLILGFGACVDTLDFEDAQGPTFFEDGEGGLVFAVNATRGGFGGTHDKELSQAEEEIVINPENFHVVLFSREGEVKQVWANQELTEFTTYDPDMKIDVTKYLVKIPRHDISDENVKYIRENEFKLAVFANWDGYPDFETEPNKVIDANGIDRNNIFYISHCRVDNSYQSGGVDGQLDDSKVFSFITGKGSKMGIAQEWVCDRFKDDNEADAAIRASYNLNDDGTGYFVSNKKPVLTNSQGESTVYNSMDDYTYTDLWRVWNFGGSRNLSNDKFYSSTNSNIRSKWASVNDDWYNACFNNYPPYNKSLPNTTTFRGFSIVSPSSGNVVTSTRTNNNTYSITLPSTSRTASQNQTISVNDGAYLHFKVPADGYLRVKCQANTYIGSANLVARRGLLGSTGNSIAVKSSSVSNNSIQTITFDYTNDGNNVVRVTDEPEDLVLYAIGGSIEIYEIDYIKSRMLQTVDRQMINPASTPEGGISMYGIQDFDKVPLDVWPEGTTFNLSRRETTHTGSGAQNYHYRTIYLLRSVSKVEVFVPTSIFPEPSHMFMRTINRFSRSAPLDVFVPTNIIWDGWDPYNRLQYNWSTVYDMKGNGHNYEEPQGVDAEANSIRQYGFNYEYGSTDEAEYRRDVAWLFGLWWKEYGWKWNNEGITIPNTKPQPYPRVFNTRISRSDYAHMIKGGKVILDGQEYYYYYAYLPEKNITDPNDKGTLGESPKVMRIEMRFADRNTDVNLDDNGCYRIYFMPGGKGQGIDNRGDYDDNMEKGNGDDNSIPMQNLHNIYPVMRNHQYRFKITGLDMNNFNVNFEVQGAETRDVNYTFE